MKFLFTTLSFLNQSFTNYLINSNFKIHQNLWVGDAGFLMYGNEMERSNFVYRRGVLCYCSNIINDTMILSSIMDFYISNYSSDKGSYSRLNLPVSSCLIYDGVQKNIHLWSDSIGASPFWYSIKKNSNNGIYNMIISDDKLGSHFAGFQTVTPTSPGQLIVIDFIFADFVHISWLSHSSERKINKKKFPGNYKPGIPNISYSNLKFVGNSKDIKTTKLFISSPNNVVEFDSMKLLAFMINDLLDLLTSIVRPTSIVVEYDTSDVSNLFLNCAADVLGIKRLSHTTGALVSTANYTTYPDITIILGSYCDI